MCLTDPLADMFTRMRNAMRAHFKTVDIPSSRIKEAVSSVLKEEGYILDYEVLPDDRQNILRVHLKYVDDNTSAIERIRRMSKPSLRLYIKAREIRPVRSYSGIAILSTTQGVLTDREARRRGVGGEVICEVV